MEPSNLAYSLKNVPIAPKKQYLKGMIDQVENFIKRLRWKAFFFEHPDANEERSKKSNLTRPQNEHLTPFENDLYDLVCNIEFKTGQNDFLKTLTSDLKKIKPSNALLVFADKTINLYYMPPDHYNSLYKNSITKTYIKTELITKTTIDKETRQLSKPLKLDIKMECYAERHAFISLRWLAWLIQNWFLRTNFFKVWQYESSYAKSDT